MVPDRTPREKRTSERFTDLAARILATPPRLGSVRLVAVDGPSGAGKTRFAQRLAGALDAPVVHTDDLLDGWADQFAFWDRLERLVLAPLRAGRPATYECYQWDRGAFGGPPVTVEPSPAVLLEGVSSARAAVRSRLSLAVFVTAPDRLRWARVLDRDGDDVAFRSYLEQWRAAERRHFAAETTAACADVVVDGAAEGTDVEFHQVWRPAPD
ncbi:uridine kinase [Krasilnikovia sp. MM14-A1004]|uniref:uridine kinase family protein n=1 Tax=Krasilnikovia sp. MM14-A1004 TaxID=3373541 RepID=UPI00399CD95B